MKVKKSEKKNKNFVNAIKCPNCGANLHPDGNSNILKCSYCESVSLYKNKNGAIKINAIEQPINITEEEIKKENETIDEVEELEEKKLEVSENTETNIKAKNINVNWKRIKRYSAAVLAALALIPSSKFIVSKLNNGKTLTSDKTISTEYNEERRKNNSRSEFDYMDFQVTGKKEITSLSLEDYEDGVVEAYNKISKYIDYDDMIKDITATFYLANYDYISEELEQKLVEKGYISGVSLFDENGKIDAKSPGFKNIERFNKLINAINDHNLFTIKRAWYYGDTDISNKLLEPSILCADKNDSEEICYLFSCLANGFNLNQNSIRNNYYYNKASSMLDSLENSSIGAKYLARKVCGIELYDFVHDYMEENYTYEELDKYFVPEQLRASNWCLREDCEPLDGSSELSFLIESHDRLQRTCLTNVNNELVNAIRGREIGESKSPTSFGRNI